MLSSRYMLNMKRLMILEYY